LVLNNLFNTNMVRSVSLGNVKITAKGCDLEIMN